MINISIAPLMRSEAEQMVINQRRIYVELYQLRSLAGVQTQQQEYAKCMGRSMRRDERIQAHFIYNVYNGKPGKEPPPGDIPDPILVNVEIQALQRKQEAETILGGRSYTKRHLPLNKL